MTDIVFDLPGAPKEHFRQGNKGVCGRLVLIQCDYVFELSNALCAARFVARNVDASARRALV